MFFPETHRLRIQSQEHDGRYNRCSHFLIQYVYIGCATFYFRLPMLHPELCDLVHVCDGLDVLGEADVLVHGE